MWHDIQQRGARPSTLLAEQSGRREQRKCTSRFASCIFTAFFEATAKTTLSALLRLFIFKPRRVQITGAKKSGAISGAANLITSVY